MKCIVTMLSLVNEEAPTIQASTLPSSSSSPLGVTSISSCFPTLIGLVIDQEDLPK